MKMIFILNLNTSHVKVKLSTKKSSAVTIPYLNTSHVKVKQSNLN